MSTTSPARTGAPFRRIAVALGTGTAIALAAALLVYAVARLTGADLVVAHRGNPWARSTPAPSW